MKVFALEYSPAGTLSLQTLYATKPPAGHIYLEMYHSTYNAYDIRGAAEQIWRNGVSNDGMWRLREIEVKP